MVKMLCRPLIAVALLFLLILALIVAVDTVLHEEVPLLYLGDYNDVDNFYIVMDVETGRTLRLQRPRGFRGITYNYGEGAPPERQDITSPYDESVQFVVLRDYQTQNPEDVEQLYRVREDDQLEPILSGEYIYMREIDFTENGRFVYLLKKSNSGIRYVFYTLYRYDIDSTELWIVAGDVPSAGLNCRENWCQVISGDPDDENNPQTLFVLHKNSGELRQVETADDITIHFWREQNVLLYTAYHGDGQATIHTYNVETDQYRRLSAIEGQGIASVYGGDWLMVTANTPEDNRVFDIYIVNDLANNPTTYPLGIQTSNATWLPYTVVSDGSVLLITLSPQNDRTSNVNIISDIATHPAVEPLTNADFDAMTLRDVRLETDLGDAHLIRVEVSDDEWRYYTLHVPTRTITQLATFKTGQWVVESRFTDDHKWLALSIEESGQYYVGIVPTDGSQPLRTWDVGTESYVCLLAWYEPDVEPPACDLYFGMG